MKSTRLMILAAIGCPLACHFAAPLPPKALELNRLGVQALEQGDLETADARFALALEYNPRFVEALVNQGLVEQQRGNFARARQLMARARRLNPDVAQPHHGLGVLAEREGRPDRAADHYRAALRVDPGFAQARANLGRLYFDSRQYQRARIQFQRLIEAAPDELLGYCGMAEALLRLGRPSEADAVLARARAQWSAEPRLELLEARRELRAGRFEAAISRLTPLVRVDDDIAVEAWAWWATAELAAGRPQRAIALADRALGLVPNQSVATEVMAQAMERLGDPEAASWRRQAERLASQ